MRARTNRILVFIVLLNRCRLCILHIVGDSMIFVKRLKYGEVRNGCVKVFWELLGCVIVSFYKEVFMPERLSASEVRDLHHVKMVSYSKNATPTPKTPPTMPTWGRTVHDLDDFLIIAGRTFMQEV